LSSFQDHSHGRGKVLDRCDASQPASYIKICYKNMNNRKTAVEHIYLTPVALDRTKND